MANALLRRAGQFGAFVLVPMEVAGGALPEVVGTLRPGIGNFAGAIVSMLHKAEIVTLLDGFSLGGAPCRRAKVKVRDRGRSRLVTERRRAR